MCWNSSCLSITCKSFYNTLIFSFFLSSHLSLVFISTVRYCLTMLPSSSQFHAFPFKDAFSTTSLYLVFQFSSPQAIFLSPSFPSPFLSHTLCCQGHRLLKEGGKNHMNTMNHSSPSTFFSLSYLLLPPLLPPSCSQRCLRCWFPLCLSGLSSAGQQQLRVTKFKCMNKKINSNNSVDTDTQCGWQSVWPSVSLMHWHSCFLNLKTLCESVCVCAGVLLKLDHYTD